MTRIEARRMTVRWWDGFKREYSIIEYEPGCDYLWMRLEDGSEKWIPTRGVRWFSSKEVARP